MKRTPEQLTLPAPPVLGAKPQLTLDAEPTNIHDSWTKAEIAEMVTKHAAVWGKCVVCDAITWVSVEYNRDNQCCAECKLGAGQKFDNSVKVVDHQERCTCADCKKKQCNPCMPFLGTISKLADGHVVDDAELAACAAHCDSCQACGAALQHA